MPAAIHRTAVFAVHDPTKHHIAVMEHAFTYYTNAYTELLHAAARFSLDDLRTMSIYALDEKTQKPRANARTLGQRLWVRDDLGKSVSAALSVLPSRLRQSVKEHAAQSIMSYIVLSDAAYADASAANASAATADADANANANANDVQTLDQPAAEAQHQEPEPGVSTAAPSGRAAAARALRTSPRGGTRRASDTPENAPTFPERRHAASVEPARVRALEELAHLGNNPRRERALVADLARSREVEVVAIPFVGVHHDYGCGLYYNAKTRRFYARLDLLSPASKYAKPISIRGEYSEVKTGTLYTSQEHPTPGLETFGRRMGSILVPLEMGRHHESALRFTTTAYLPQRGTDVTHPVAAEPVSGKLVRKHTKGGIQYQVHIAFALPAPPARDKAEDARRPLLAINRGLHQIYRAVVVNVVSGQQLVPSFAAQGDKLLQVQQALERIRQQRQQRQAAPPLARDRRQRRIAAEHVAIAANQIVEAALQQGALVVIEDLSNFASGNVTRATKHPVRRQQSALRTMLNRRQFEALHHALDQRLELVGLPPVRQVPAGNISRVCPACGYKGDDNHDANDLRRFRCARCSYSADSDEAAALNVARRLLWLRVRKEQKDTGVAEAARTPYHAFVAALNGLPTHLGEPAPKATTEEEDDATAPAS